MQWVHNGIRTLLWIAPMTALTIVPVISEHFPHKRMPINRVKGYFAQVLKLCTYAPAIRDRVLRIIIDRLIEIDVEIKIEEGYAIINHDEDVFDMDDTGAGEDNEDKVVTVDEMAEKLDVCMESLFEFLDREGCRNQETSDILFASLVTLLVH